MSYTPFFVLALVKLVVLAVLVASLLAKWRNARRANT